jgi:hypothetical protein
MRGCVDCITTAQKRFSRPISALKTVSPLFCQDLEPPKLFFGGRQIMGVGVRRTITEVGTLIEASDTEPFQSGVQAGQR